MKTMPKLLQISIEVNSGSVGRIAEQIGQKAIENGWKSYITYARNNLPSKSKLIKIGNKLGVYFHGLMTRITDKHAFYSTYATKKLITQIQKIKPDIIHLHHLHGYFINIKILFEYLSKANIPIVWTFHDCWSFTGHCTHFEYVGCNKWKTECFQCPQKKEYPASYIIDRSKKNYRQKRELFNSVQNMTIVPVSYWLGDLVKQSFLNNYSIQVIQNGIDLEIFKPYSNLDDIKHKYNLSNQFVILGVASAWEPRKGLNEFIKLNHLLKNNEQIILVGLSKKQKKQLPSSIIGIERTENVHQLAELYSLADVFVNPTFEDTFPTTNLEALACGTPVITYKTGGSVEAVNEETGLIVEKGNIEKLWQGVRHIQDKERGYYVSKCRDRAIKYYNKLNRFSDYIELYNNLLRK